MQDQLLSGDMTGPGVFTAIAPVSCGMESGKASPLWGLRAVVGPITSPPVAQRAT